LKVNVSYKRNKQKTVLAKFKQVVVVCVQTSVYRQKKSKRKFLFTTIPRLASCIACFRWIFQLQNPESSLLAQAYQTLEKRETVVNF